MICSGTEDLTFGPDFIQLNQRRQQAVPLGVSDNQGAPGLCTVTFVLQLWASKTHRTWAFGKIRTRQ